MSPNGHTKPAHAHIPDEKSRKTVESMTGFGIPQAEVAAVLGISEPTLRKHYRRELDLGITKANAQVIANLFKHATGNGRGAVTAGIFWAKTRCGWKEKVTLEHGGTDGGPVKLELEFVKADGAPANPRAL